MVRIEACNVGPAQDPDLTRIQRLKYGPDPDLTGRLICFPPFHWKLLCLRSSPERILKDDASEEKGERARMSSFIGAMAIADLVKTTLGPKGMDKILQSTGRGRSVTVTNDGATILKSLHIDNPAAKVLVDISKAQDDEVGDGTTSVVVLAGELLREAEKLVAMKIHPMTIIAGYRMAAECARDALLKRVVDNKEDAEKFRTDLLKIAMTTLSSKILSQDKEHFAKLAVDAVMRLKGSTNLESIQIIKKPGGSLIDSFLDEGFILDKKIGIGQPKRIENAKILVANTAMDTDKVKIYGARVRVDSMAKVAEIESAEKDKMREKVTKILGHGINCFINRQLIYNFPEELFADAGILAIEHADFDGIERLALVTGGEIASTFDNPESVKLGHCKLIEEIMIGEDKLIHFSGVAMGQACTIVLRGASEHVLDEAERSLHDALCVLSQTVNDSRVLLGGGWPEMVMTKEVDELARKTPGKKSHAIDAFSRALQAIPTTIADNAGLDSAELISQLRAEHHKEGCNAGIDVITGRVGDMAELGISEAFKVKQAVLLSATEAAEMILRVDEIITCAPRQREDRIRRCKMILITVLEITKDSFVTPGCVFFLNSSCRGCHLQIHSNMDMKKLQEYYSQLCLSSFSSSSSSASNFHPEDVGAEHWETADSMADEILTLIQPTAMSERRRKEIIEYIQILFGASYGIKVFPFGSVPLKTYLPDGDIDLSAVCNNGVEHLSSIFCSLLQNEATTNPRIQVTNVHSVPAQVKVVKCHVEGIPVDICFNQIDGLCALSFLEQVDQLIGKNHLYKRSVILVKAWCFYEGRLLGANYGLISTYALETMVAHIINLFHSSLHSPLAVLYKFLGYYSELDWENHCVAIDGLVPISSLPEVVATPPDNSDEMLLSAEFLKKCREAYSFATGINQTGGPSFHVKFLNVIDPLRNNNNIGRSVHKASFNRIKFAFGFATENLKAILASPVEDISYGIGTFFKTTFGRIRRQRLDGVPVAEQSENHTHDNGNLLAGIQYGLWSHYFGIYQGCNDPKFSEMFDQLASGRRYDLNAMFQVNESFDPENLSGVTKVPVLGDMASRGTGTYIPQMRAPFQQSRRRTIPYMSSQKTSLDVNSDPAKMIEAEEKAVKEMMKEKLNTNHVVGEMEEFPDSARVRLGDEVEFPPLCKGGYKRK
ncbi:hypothetical protein V2J09_023247 [Rumex salicifolius]